MKLFLYITLIATITFTFNACGKKGDLEEPGKNYPKEYPSE